MFVLGIDPGLTTTGYGVIDNSGRQPVAVAAGVFRTSPSLPIHLRLAEIHTDITDLIADYSPTTAAIEEVFVNRNRGTAMSVGRASGVVLLALAQANIDVAEYSPSAIKMALTGYGGADKDQMTSVVTMRLKLDQTPKPADAADALAIALCHIQSLPMRAAIRAQSDAAAVSQAVEATLDSA